MTQPTPTYVHRIVDAWLFGQPLDFDGVHVPSDIQDRLEGAAVAGRLVTAPDAPPTAELDVALAPGLTPEQEIRARALDAAARLHAEVELEPVGGEPPTVLDRDQTVIGTAIRFADWITDGSTP